MTKLFPALFALVAAIALAIPQSTSAALDTSFTFTFTDGGITATGWLEGIQDDAMIRYYYGVPQGISAYYIVSGGIDVTGTPDASILDQNPGVPFVTGTGTLLPVSPMGAHIGYFFYVNDQLFTPSDPGNDGTLVFTFNPSATAFDPYPYFTIGSGGGYYNYFHEAVIGLRVPPFEIAFNDSSGNFALTPEPSSLLLLGTVLLGLALIGFRKMYLPPTKLP